MSVDLTAVAEALFRWNTTFDPYFVIHGRAGGADDDEDPYRPIVRALAPVIEAAVRESIAAEIEAWLIDDPNLQGENRNTALLDAARIARGAL